MTVLTSNQTEAAIEAAIVASLPDGEDSENYYVYVSDHDESTAWYYSDGQYFEVGYEIDEDGNVTLSGDPVVVRPVTTYVPVQENQRAGLEHRALPHELLRQVAPTVAVKSEPLTYHRRGQFSFFRDFALQRRGEQAANDRLVRHSAEMRVISKEREQRALRGLRSGELEYRIDPNRVDGEGGYFAPPLWLNELFATAARPGRVLAGLIPGQFDLPAGASSVNTPILTTGTQVLPTPDLQGVPDQEIVDAPGSSGVTTLSGQSDVPMQLLEQSPAGAHLDWAILLDLDSAYNDDLEVQLLYGLGLSASQLLGVANVTGINTVTYTDATPTGSEIYASLGNGPAKIGDNRGRPPEVWLLRTARWAWLMTQEDTAGLPFGLPSPFFMGADENTPDPVGGLIGWPVFPDDAIPANLGVGNNQDVAISLRPSDLILLESAPKTAVMTEILSGNLNARIQMHRSVAAITNRYPSGISVVGGTGFVVQSGE